ncbi:MAG TPA: GNAT family N-acetyltransferase [Actinomycetes bacterium]|nr:GNAT family N-acetyltransferase [Actinomycetes bacterium]
MEQVPLSAGDFLLRAWTASDLDFVLAAARDPEIARFSSVGVSVTPEAGREWIRKRAVHDRLDWVIEHAGAPIGRVSVAHINTEDSVGEIGYWVIPERRRARVATTAVAAVEQHAFSALGLMRLVIKHEPENHASCALALSRGYLAEGTERGAFSRAGARRDLHVHGLLITDR